MEVRGVDSAFGDGTHMLAIIRAETVEGPTLARKTFVTVLVVFGRYHRLDENMQ